MEAALTWLFGSVNCRVPDGRTSSFTQPLVPTLPPKARPPKGVQACPLPSPRPFRRPISATVGWRVHDWADHSAFYITNSRGQRIFVQLWRPIQAQPSQNSFLRFVSSHVPFLNRPKEKAIVYIIHGLNDHSNKYSRVAKKWVEAGYAVVAHDFHGHGRSDGFRAYTSSIQHYVQDAHHAISHSDHILPNRFSSLPKFLLAHSLGGAVAIHLARDSPPGTFKGVMLTAPAVRVFPKPLLKLFAPVIANLAPLLPVQRLKFDRVNQLRNKLLNKNELSPDSDDDYSPHDDPLIVRSPVRARVGYEVLKSCEKIMNEAGRFRLPVFVAHSANDRVTNAKGTVEFHARIGSHDKTVRLYKGNVHDLLSQKRDLVVGDMIEWASTRL